MAKPHTAELPAELSRMLEPYSVEVRDAFAAARGAVIRQAPAAVELLYDSYNAVASAYSFTARLRDAFCHVAAYSRHVNLGFNRGAELSDPECILQGSGKLIRHVRIASTADVEQPLVIALIREAAAGAPKGRDAGSKSVVIGSTAPRKRRPANN